MKSRHHLALLAWLTSGHAVLFGLFWLLLHVPESNVVMLAASGLIVLAMVALAGLVEGGGLTLAAPGSSTQGLARTLIRAPLAAPLAVALFGVVWLLTGSAATGWSGHRGEVDAWFMLHVGWARTARLHDAVWWIIAFLRYVVGISLALALLGWAVSRGLASLARGRWLAAALSPLRLALIAALLLVLVWLPWRAVYWRPAWVAATWQEPTFVAVKLAVLYLLANIGWAGILSVVERGLRPPTGTPAT